ncbi:MAG: hypothetical protein AAGK66_11640, partial [Pseudomonadota bacterium]
VGFPVTAHFEASAGHQIEIVQCVFHPNSSDSSGRLPGQISEMQYKLGYDLFRDKKRDFVRQYGNILVPRGAALLIEFRNDDCKQDCTFEILITRKLEYQSRIYCQIID